MKRLSRFSVLPIAALSLTACGSDDAPAPGAAAKTPDAPAAIEPLKDEIHNLTSKPQGPVRFNYRVIGTPVVGQPVTIDLVVESNVGNAPVRLVYSSNDSTAMSFPDTQAEMASIAFVDDDLTSSQQVTVIPAREGRLFLNVVATLETETGSMQTAKSIPIQVGAAPRDLTPTVPTTTDEDGNQLREMPAD